MRHLEAEPPMIRIKRKLAATALAMSAATSVTLAQGSAPNACAAAERHKFDFWIGEWEVKGAGVVQEPTQYAGAALGGLVEQEEARPVAPRQQLRRQFVVL